MPTTPRVPDATIAELLQILDNATPMRSILLELRERRDSDGKILGDGPSFRAVIDQAMQSAPEPSGNPGELAGLAEARLRCEKE